MSKTNLPLVSHIIPSEEYFEITNVQYKGNPHTYRLYTKMTNSMNQDKLAEFYETEKQKGNSYPMDSILHFSIFNSAIKSKDSDLLNFIQSGLRRDPNTLSRVICNPLEKDKIIHNYGTSDAYSFNRNILGKAEWIKDVNDKKSLELLTGIKDIKKLNKISRGINKAPMYIHRFSSKPSEKIEWVIGFDALGVVMLNLDAGRALSFEFPAFRVLQID